MNAVPLGKLDGLEDAAVVKQAAHLPVQAVVVVRVMSTGSGPLAVVTGFDRSGKSVFGFSGAPGRPIELGDAQRTASIGVGTEAVSAVTAVSRQAEADYEERQVGIAAYGNMAWGKMQVSHANPYRGVLKQEIGWEEFYRTVGRNDLADRYAGGMATRTTVTLVGAGVAVGGLALAIFAQQPVLGLSAVAAGGLTAAIAARWDVNPVSYEEAAQLAEQYNDALRNGKVTTRSSGWAPRIALAPTFGPQGAGVSLHGTF